MTVAVFSGPAGDLASDEDPIMRKNGCEEAAVKKED